MFKMYKLFHFFGRGPRRGLKRVRLRVPQRVSQRTPLGLSQRISLRGPLWISQGISLRGPQRVPKIHIKFIGLYLAVVLFFLLLVPVCALKLFPGLTEEAPQTKYTGEIPDTVRVFITEKEKFETIDFETYIEGVVASEMPASFDTEALKAQAIASRTYALGRINGGAELCDTVHCQVYRSNDISLKVRRAVRATRGQVLLYDGALATQALYFSSSAGPTENAEDVFSNAYPYLVSVSSSEEPDATHKQEIVRMPLADFADQLETAFPELNFGKITSKNIKILSHTTGGRVNKIRIGSKSVTLTGADLRRAFNLYSTRFDIDFEEGADASGSNGTLGAGASGSNGVDSTGSAAGTAIVITTSGSGHGVGMSQYGANGLAKKGYDYEAILKHYYQGVTISE